MNFKYIYIALVVLFCACDKQDFTYRGKAYIQFSKTTDNISVSSANNSYSFEIHSIAMDTQKALTVEVIVDTLNSDLKEGKHFTIKNNSIEINPGEYLTQGVINFNYKQFEAQQSGNILLRLKKQNTEIGTADSLILKVTQEDWIKDFTGKFKLSYSAKNKTQEAIADIEKIEIITDDDNNTQYKLTIIGLPVWTFSSGPKLNPEKFIMYFNKYSDNKTPLILNNQIIAEPTQYQSWFMSFDYGTLKIDNYNKSFIYPFENKLILNYKIILGQKEVLFENVIFQKINSETSE